jgi:hypothetical protein
LGLGNKIKKVPSSSEIIPLDNEIANIGCGKYDSYVLTSKKYKIKN